MTDDLRARIAGKLDRAAGQLTRMDPVRPIDLHIAVEAGRDALAALDLAESARDRLAARVAELEAARTDAARLSHAFRNDRDRLATLAREILGQYWEKGHPGYPAVRTHWLEESTVARWREVLAASTATAEQHLTAAPAASTSANEEK